MDMHSSCLTPEAAEMHRKELFRTFSSLIGVVKEERADILIISGDLFEIKCARSSDIKRIADFFREIPSTRVFIACGNHDPLSRMSLYENMEFPENVTVFPSELSMIELEDLNTCVYGFSWSRERYESIPFSLPEPDRSKKNILVLHADVLSHSGYMPVNAKTLAGAGFDYVALGHIHKPGFVRENIAYPGSPEPLDFSEEGDHGYIIINEENGKLVPEFVPFASTKFVNASVDVTGITDHPELNKRVTEAAGEAENAYVRLTLRGIKDEGLDTGYLADETGRKYRFFTVDDQTKRDLDLLSIYRENPDNLIGRFVLALMNDAASDETARTALYAGLDALMESAGEAK